ncbi:hypothetical protein ACOSQ4_033114 [Xanthoceras sorbifolium]
MTTQMHGDWLPEFSPSMQKALGRLGERLYDEANDLAGKSNDVIRTLNSLKIANMTKDSLGYIKVQNISSLGVFFFFSCWEN